MSVKTNKPNGCHDLLNHHVPVRLASVIAALNIQPGELYCDATFGRGGHSRAILEALQNSGHLYAFDVDQHAKNYFVKHFASATNCTFIADNFVNLAKHLPANQMAGILFDLGASSPMYSTSAYGLSYQIDSKLDMRFDQTTKRTAYEIVNQFSAKALVDIFQRYGEIKAPHKVVNAICAARQKAPITTTLQLVNIIGQVLPVKVVHSHKPFAINYFQALRIAVNNELEVLEQALHQAVGLLKKNGRIVTISFHSLEEKVIKKVYATYLQNYLPKEIPLNSSPSYKIIRVSKRPTAQEVGALKQNRSAFIKVFCKL